MLIIKKGKKGRKETSGNSHNIREDMWNGNVDDLSYISMIKLNDVSSKSRLSWMNMKKSLSSEEMSFTRRMMEKWMEFASTNRELEIPMFKCKSHRKKAEKDNKWMNIEYL
jgi:hypothetical protein